MTTDAAIHVQGLEKSYKELRVLRGVDFEVARGSIFALLGSNGAGKTTIVNILSTLLRPDAGMVTVDGFGVGAQAADVRESISLTGQFAAVDEILTGRENLVLVARLRHLKGAGQIADDLLARFQLTDAAGRRVATYSGGMRRRLDIAMSLIGNPPVIFLDEPTTGLDPESRLEVHNSVKQLARRGTTVLLTTQYLDEAEQLADRIAILHQGRIIANGTLAELKQLLPPAQVEYVERFQSMPIARSSALWAHVLTSLVANLISLVLVVLVAVAMGFRTGAPAAAWLAVAGILVLFTLALTWIAVIAGLSAKTVEGAGAFAYPIIFLPFISSAFVPTATMPGPVRAFADNQPVTSIVNTVRDLFAQQPVSTSIWTALAWCAGILIVAYALAMVTYRRKIA